VSFVPTFFLPFLIAIPAGVYLLVWFAFQIISGIADSAVSSGVAYWAHIGGFVIGMIWGLFRRKKVYYY
ncbi:MAG TPA: rhomboid family intramembrane serine protease, partial [Pseudothermotoga sp.]